MQNVNKFNKTPETSLEQQLKQKMAEMEKKHQEEMLLIKKEHKTEVENLKTKHKLIRDELETIKRRKIEDTAGSSQQNKILPQFASNFVIKNVFTNISKMKEGKFFWSSSQEGLRDDWKIRIRKYGGFLDFFFHCEKAYRRNRWTIEADVEFKVIHPCRSTMTIKADDCNGAKVSWASNGHFRLNEMEKYIWKDTLTIEVHVYMRRMIGFNKEFRSFDGFSGEPWDVILIVKEQEFHVSKKILASQSPYFKAMFMGNFMESKAHEVHLHGINSWEFQRYLEVLYSQIEINDENIGEISKARQLMFYQGYPAVSRVSSDVFIIKHCFKNFSKLEEGRIKTGSDHYLFGVPWKIGIRRKNAHLEVFIRCNKADMNTDRLIFIDAEYFFVLMDRSGNTISHKTIWCDEKLFGWTLWNDVDDYMIPDDLVVEVHVDIQSIREIDESVIDDFNVEGIMFLSHMYDTPSVFNKCEQFLLNESIKSSVRKLELALRFDSEKLKKQRLRDTDIIQRIRRSLPSDIQHMSNSTLADLFDFEMKRDPPIRIPEETPAPPPPPRNNNYNNRRRFIPDYRHFHFVPRYVWFDLFDDM